MAQRMSPQPAKRVESVHGYYVVGSPSYPRSPPSSRSGSSTSSQTTRTLVRDKNGELRSEQRLKLATRPSQSLSSQGGSTMGASTSSRQGSPIKNMNNCCGKQMVQSEDEEDGSMILVQVPARKVIKTGSNTVDLADVSTAHLVRSVSTALSVDGGRSDEVAKDRRYQPGSALSGLTEAMKLEGQLLLLKRELRLYQHFDKASGRKSNFTS